MPSASRLAQVEAIHPKSVDASKLVMPDDSVTDMPGLQDTDIWITMGLCGNQPVSVRSIRKYHIERRVKLSHRDGPLRQSIDERAALCVASSNEFRPVGRPK